MRIAMLGWEFPPFISGGLGTACYGLTKALDQRGHEILFVLPRPVDRSRASHIRLLSPEGIIPAAPPPAPVGGPSPAVLTSSAPISTSDETAAAMQSEPPHAMPPEQVFSHTQFIGVPASFRSPYPGGSAVVGKRKVAKPGAFNPDGSQVMVEASEEEATALEHHTPIAHAAPTDSPSFGKTGAGAGYQGDLIAESERYARLVVALTRGQKIDVIHAHDWLTYPAGIALARVANRPLVIHVHSTEFDRSGENVNQRVYDIERRGMLAAVRILAVSELTKSICVRRYGIPEAKIDVVYNGIENDALQPGPGASIKSRDKIVLFLGRITMQKGPEYFISAAQKVLEKVPEAKFIIAGSGDMETRMIELAAEMGIGHRVLFTGFLRGKDVDRVYRMADCYVMPSVSEPFGIAPLEAMRNDVPTIISKQSGVSEVLTHVLKVDFWDTHEMANKIVAVLRHPPLSQTLREHGSVELKRLTWGTAADACGEAYEKARTSHVGMGVG